MKKSRLLYQREWYRKNPDKVKEYRKKHYLKKLESGNKWRRNNPGRMSAYKYVYRDNLKIKVLSHYSNGDIKCAKCGYSNIDALCLDHIKNDGAKQRKLLKISSRGNISGQTTYAVVLKLKFPKGLQVLCANCNLIKEIERKRILRLKNIYYVRRKNKTTS